jgi:hypothetical protein
MGLEIHEGGVKLVDFLDWWSAVVSVRVEANIN